MRFWGDAQCISLFDVGFFDEKFWGRSFRWNFGIELLETKHFRYRKSGIEKK